MLAIDRPSWDEVWISISLGVARRSRCVPSQVGCVIVAPNNTAAAISYNGPPADYRWARRDTPCTKWCPHAIDANGGQRDYTDCVSSHAEANGLMQADRRLIAGGTIYVTRVPCFMCAKMIANSGIARAVFPITEDDADRRPDNSITILKDSGVEVTLWKV